MSNEETLGALVRNSGSAGEFRPCAIFDEYLDCIRVVTRDCSTTEIRVDGLMTVLEDNYPSSEANMYVGFTIKGARHFCKQNGFSLTTPVKIAAVLDAILATSPDPVVRMIVRTIARPMVTTTQIDDVDLQLASVN